MVLALVIPGVDYERVALGVRLPLCDECALLFVEADEGLWQVSAPAFFQSLLQLLGLALLAGAVRDELVNALSHRRFGWDESAAELLRPLWAAFSWGPRLESPVGVGLMIILFLGRWGAMAMGFLRRSAVLTAPLG